MFKCSCKLRMVYFTPFCQRAAEPRLLIFVRLCLGMIQLICLIIHSPIFIRSAPTLFSRLISLSLFMSQSRFLLSPPPEFVLFFSQYALVFYRSPVFGYRKFCNFVSPYDDLENLENKER